MQKLFTSKQWKI